MSRKFSVGDRVRIPGGPTMVVEGYEEIDGSHYVVCRWWSQKDEDYKRDYFTEETLQPPPSTRGSVIR